MGKSCRQTGFLVPSSLLLACILLTAAQTGPAQAQNAGPGPATNVAPQQLAITTFADAIRVLGHERSAAEAYATLLDAHGKKDMARYVEGVRLYSEARADFDGMIEQLKYDLNQGLDLKTSPAFGQLLDNAARKRVAFTEFVSQDILSDVQGAKPALPDVIAAVPNLVKVLMDAGLNIWKEFRAGDRQRREDIRNQLDALKWRAFADLVRA